MAVDAAALLGGCGIVNASHPSGIDDLACEWRRRHPSDDVVLAPQTWRLLRDASSVTVVTNNRAIPDDYFDGIASDEHDVFVVFNRHRFTLDERVAARTIWVHRLDEHSGTFFGVSQADDSVARAFHHLYVAGQAPECFAMPAGASYVSYRAPLPALEDYPVGRRSLVVHRGIHRIVSASTGFVMFALLDAMQRVGVGFRTRAIGVGREYDGWPGHDWVFERLRLARSGIDFRTPDGRPDPWHGFRDRVPYGIMRLFWKLRRVQRAA